MKRKSSKQKKKLRKHRHHTRHHVNPTSRGYGDEDNIVLLPRAWHAMWHQLFVNLTLDEVHDYIDLVMQPNHTWTHGDLLRMLEAMRAESNWTTSED